MVINLVFSSCVILAPWVFGLVCKFVDNSVPCVSCCNDIHQAWHSFRCQNRHWNDWMWHQNNVWSNSQLPSTHCHTCIDQARWKNKQVCHRDQNNPSSHVQLSGAMHDQWPEQTTMSHWTWHQSNMQLNSHVQPIHHYRHSDQFQYKNRDESMPT